MFLEVLLLAEPGIRRGNENRKSLEKVFSMGKKPKYTFFKQTVAVDKYRYTKAIFFMNLSVLDFFKFASRMPQIVQILVSTFKIFRGIGGRGGGGGRGGRTLLEIFFFFH